MAARPSPSPRRCPATRSWTTSRRRPWRISSFCPCWVRRRRQRLGSAGVPVGALAEAPARDLPHAEVGRILGRAGARARDRRVLDRRPGGGHRGAARAAGRRGRRRAGRGRRRGRPHRRAGAPFRGGDHGRLLPDGGGAGGDDRRAQRLLSGPGADRAHPRPGPHQLAAGRPGRGGRRRATRRRPAGKRHQAQSRPRDQRRPVPRRPRRRAGDGPREPAGRRQLARPPGRRRAARRRAHPRRSPVAPDANGSQRPPRGRASSTTRTSE